MPSGNICLEILQSQNGEIPVIEYILFVPTMIFISFLLYHLKPALRKLRNSESLEMGSYYGFLWFVCIVNILRLLIQLMLSDTPDSVVSPLIDMCWIIIRFFLLFIEVSVIVFMSHKHSISGAEAFKSTVQISGIIAFSFSVLISILVFVEDLSIFDLTPGPSALFWFFFNLITALVYFVLIVIPHTRWASQLPERPEFFRYVFLLFCLNSIAALGAILTYSDLPIGYCFWDFGIILYYSLYPPLLYFSFLHQFLKSNTTDTLRDALVLDRYLEVVDTDF